jgi:hypothetical protein
MSTPLVIWFWSANSHTGQQLNAALQAGQMAASDYLSDLPDTACVRRGVHRWKAEWPILYRGLSQQAQGALRRRECAGLMVWQATKYKYCFSAGLEIATRGSCFSPG